MGFLPMLYYFIGLPPHPLPTSILSTDGSRVILFPVCTLGGCRGEAKKKKNKQIEPGKLAEGEVEVQGRGRGEGG